MAEEGARGFVDSAPDCCIAVPSSIPPPGTPPSLGKLLQEGPAQMICSAQEEPPQRRKFNEDESFKIPYCKSKKKYIKKSTGKGTKVL